MLVYREVQSECVCGLLVLHWESAGGAESDWEGGGVARHESALAGNDCSHIQQV